MLYTRAVQACYKELNGVLAVVTEHEEVLEMVKSILSDGAL